MRQPTILLFLALLNGAGLSMSAGQQYTIRPTQGAVSSVCELAAAPARYSSRRIRMTATIVAGEASIFVDESCPPSATKPAILATFDEKDYEFDSPLDKKLTKILNRKRQARVTVVGTLVDPGHYVGHQNCCRYKFEVKELLCVEDKTK